MGLIRDEKFTLSEVEGSPFIRNKSSTFAELFCFKESGKSSYFRNVQMKKPSFDDIYMDLAVNLSQKSHCVKAQVGAVLAKDTRIISVGYNGPPAGTHNCDTEWPGVGCPRDSKNSCSLALHAEQNAILYATKNNVSMQGSALYITLAPCISCARVIYTVGIKKVIFLNSYAEMKGLPNEEGADFLKKFGVEVIKYKKQ